MRPLRARARAPGGAACLEGPNLSLAAPIFPDTLHVTDRWRFSSGAALRAISSPPAIRSSHIRGAAPARSAPARPNCALRALAIPTAELHIARVALIL